MPIELDPKQKKQYDLFADIKGIDFNFDPLQAQKELNADIDAVYQAIKNGPKDATKKIKSLEACRSKGYMTNILYSVKSKLSQDAERNPLTTRNAIEYIDRELERRNPTITQKMH